MTASISLSINGKPTTLNAPLNLSDLLAQQGYSDKLIAAALNGDFVPKSAYTSTELKNGDEIEIVAPMQGG